MSLPNGLPCPLEMRLAIKDIPGIRRPPLGDSTHLAADIQRRASVGAERASAVEARASVAATPAAATRAGAVTGITIKESDVPVWHCTLSANLSLARGLREKAAAFYAADRCPRAALFLRPCLRSCLRSWCGAESNGGGPISSACRSSICCSVPFRASPNRSSLD